MQLRPFFSLSVVFLLGLSSQQLSSQAFAPRAEQPPPVGLPTLPSYAFEVGQELSFAGEKNSVASYGETHSEVEWKFWVVRLNEDGSHRLVFERSTETRRKLRSGELREQPVSRSRGWVDMRSDGAFPVNPSIALGLDPSVVLVPLPRSLAEAASGWTCLVPIFDRRYRGRLSSEKNAAEIATKGEAPSAAVRRISCEVDSPSHRNYLQEESCQVEFDTARGFPLKIDTFTRSTWRSESTSRGVIELTGVERRDVAWAQQLAEELQHWFETKRSYDKVTLAGRTDAEHKDKRLSRGLQMLKDARERVKMPAVRKMFDELIVAHERREKYVSSYASRIGKILNKPSPDWAASTLGGEGRSLTDYAGKVLVLDFWYRGCGWCVRAMPQMNALADHYRGKAVAIMGVNKDKDLADAKFTVEAVGMRYESLHSEEIPKLYHILGYPTLVVIDTKGVVRDVHIGYSTDLQQSLTVIIDGLLAERD